MDDHALPAAAALRDDPVLGRCIVVGTSRRAAAIAMAITAAVTALGVFEIVTTLSAFDPFWGLVVGVGLLGLAVTIAMARRGTRVLIGENGFWSYPLPAPVTWNEVERVELMRPFLMFGTSVRAYLARPELYREARGMAPGTKPGWIGVDTDLGDLPAKRVRDLMTSALTAYRTREGVERGAPRPRAPRRRAR